MNTTHTLPFSKLRCAAGLAFLSGELPIDEQGNIPDGIAAQTDLTLRRLATTLSAAGLSLADVVQATVYLTHPEDFTEFNAAYIQHFDGVFPARATVVAPLVVPGARIEIAFVAADRES